MRQAPTTCFFPYLEFEMIFYYFHRDFEILYNSDHVSVDVQDSADRMRSL